MSLEQKGDAVYCVQSLVMLYCIDAAECVLQVASVAEKADAYKGEYPDQMCSCQCPVEDFK